MIKINFTEEEIEKLRYERFNHLHPRVQLKMNVLLLKVKGLKHKEICDRIFCPRRAGCRPGAS